MRHRFIIALGMAVACAACSQQHDGNAPSASAPTTAATSPHPTLATTPSSPNGLTYLYDLMQRPDFSTAFAALSGADQLPAWAKQGGVATPANRSCWMVTRCCWRRRASRMIARRNAS
nr:hypothetical protein [Dyella sp. ASV24]